MRRDDDYLRELLLEVEEAEIHVFVAILTYSASPEGVKRHYHAELLCDAGLATRVGKGTYRLTNQGHDYLEAIRQDTIWEKTKRGASEVGGASLGMMKDIALAYLRQRATDVLGIDIS